ncbi:ABC transporter ATP-binding protein [Leucobacter sp. UCMA 4100]|uniref:ABC transporter ATP-binding protein n=1 Tax=Leucobacter sp. UCMA 4100 TaxID=2810534 RepID=UPI0022EA2979|nr:ABC transporter ATP-binding protein [Leucobacter sp. UCMA 4100]MDA3147185.1 ABC transporter ATP-binding protein [Leucobacter sp. UCMA 4100]
MTPVLQLRKVTRSYGSPPTEALRGVDLHVDEGEFVAVVGPSGSGKSTLLNLIGTLDRASTGEVLITGARVDDLSDARLSALRAHTIGFVFQQFHLSDGQTTVDNVGSGLLYTGMSRALRREQAREALISVGLGHRLDHKPKQLSGGERQRVAIARAIVRRPALLLADEPTGSLDSTSGETVVQLLRELNSKGTTIVLITHDRELAEQLPRRVSIRDGLIVADSANPGIAKQAQAGGAS